MHTNAHMTLQEFDRILLPVVRAILATNPPVDFKTFKQMVNDPPAARAHTRTHARARTHTDSLDHNPVSSGNKVLCL